MTNTGMMIELLNGDWIDPTIVRGVRFVNDKHYGPRVVTDTAHEAAAFFFYLDDAEVARAWVKDFGAKVNDQRHSEGKRDSANDAT